MLSMGQAATEVGISKSMLTRNGATRSGNGSVAHHATADDTPAATDEPPVLKAEIEGLRAQLALMREQSDDLRKDRDHWRCQAEARLLSDQPSAQRSGRRGIFGWRKAG